MHARPTHPTGTPRQGTFGWSRRNVTWSVAIVAVLGLTLLSPSGIQARAFQCRTGDVACLIASIEQAKAQPGQSHEIRLEAGIYPLTQVDNTIDGGIGYHRLQVISPFGGRGLSSRRSSGMTIRPPFV